MNQQMAGTAQEQWQAGQEPLLRHSGYLAMRDVWEWTREIMQQMNAYVAPSTRLQLIDQRISDCRAHRKAAIMRAAAAMGEE